MSDVARYLPLSQNPREDESGVSSDWSKQLSGVLNSLAAAVDGLSVDELDAASLQPGYRVRDVLGHTAWHLGTPRRARAKALLRQMAVGRQTPAAARRALSVDAARATAADPTPSPAGGLRALAAAAAAPGTRSTIADLSVVVVDALDVARSTGRTIPIDGLSTGAVALARSLSAPTPIRAVVRQRTLTASDAGWTVGTGRELRGSAAAIVLFLWGRADIPHDAQPHDAQPHNDGSHDAELPDA
ncbi:MAG: hypothetical protein ABWY54_02020 [Glaciihabitans sp.]